MRTKTEPGAAEFVRDAATWPSMRDLATRYGVSPRFVRGVVERGCVESVHLDRIRVNESDWIEFLRSRHTPRQR